MKRYLWRGVLLGLVLFAGATVVTLGVLVALGRHLPDPHTITAYRPKLASQVFDRNGAVIAKLYVERRELVSLQHIPEHVRNAFISTEDKRFWSHPGIDLVRILKAALVDLIQRRRAQGASTITQQLARNMFLSHEKTIPRKIREALLAVQIERVFSKEEILERYLNQIYFGHGVYGVQAASRFFFGKPVDSLTAAEAALLAAIPKNPSLYSPIRHYDRALKRQRLILRMMYLNGFLTEEEYQRALQEPVVIHPASDVEYRVGPYFVDMVRQYILRRYSESFLYGGGAQIFTTLDARLQALAEQVVDSILDTLEAEFQLHPSLAERDTGDTTPPQYLQAALVALDPVSGEILALVGGRNYQHSKFNRVTQAHRQPGSAFKPIVYTTAIDQGYEPGSLVYDLPVTLHFFREGIPERWSPANFDGRFLGAIPLRTALAKSRNLATVRLILQIGPRQVVRYARRMGIQSRVPAYPSIALGAASLTPLELATAYATLANHGVRTDPYFIRMVSDIHGHQLEINHPHRVRVLDDVTAYLVTSMLESVVNEGTGGSIRWRYGLKFPIAGKTGTTNDYRDAWFIGYTSNLLVAVWVGYDQPRTIMDKATGARMAIPIFATFLKRVYADSLWPPPVEFLAPSNVEYATVCVASGQLATPFCPQVREEVYREGKAPTGYCPLHTPRPRGDEIWPQAEVAALLETRRIP